MVWPPTAQSLEDDKHATEPSTLKPLGESQEIQLILQDVGVIMSSFTSIFIKEVCHIMSP